MAQHIDLEPIKRKLATAYEALFGGRIARTTFVIRVSVLVGVIFVLGLPFTTFLGSSSKTLRDAYLACSLVIMALCLCAFVSAYVKRLHDIGLRGYWTLICLAIVPSAVGMASSVYVDYRLGLDSVVDTAGIIEVSAYIALLIPAIVALWRGEKTENRFGPVPQPVEHFLASKFSIAAFAGAAAIVIPTSIYAGLLQDGVWVGRGDFAPPMPMIDSGSTGRLFAKCWNIKGVGAGIGKGAFSGVYRDGYSDSVFDFVVSDAGEIDIVPAGKTISESYRSDGFNIYSYGLTAPSGQVDVGDQRRFMIAAVHDGSQLPDGTINFTTFSFARTGDTWPEWQMVMSTGMNLGESSLLTASAQARGRLMIGDCIVR